MNNRSIILFIFFSVFAQNLLAQQNLLPIYYKACTNCDSTDSEFNPYTHTYTYNPQQTQFSAANVASDYGPRPYNGYDMFFNT